MWLKVAGAAYKGYAIAKAKLDEAREEGKKEERAKICTWLRKHPGGEISGHLPSVLATEIELGRHNVRPNRK